MLLNCLPVYVYFYLVEVISSTTLQLTCSSQWNSSRYQYVTALHFNLSESTIIVLIESFDIEGVLIFDKDGSSAGVPRLLTKINPRTVSPIFRYCIRN